MIKNTTQLLVEYKELIDKNLLKYFKALKIRYKHHNNYISSYINSLEEFTLRGGKRLRPALIYYTYLMYSKGQEKDVSDMSMFMELIQSFLLIHDDIIDKSDLRRNKITIHKYYENYAKKNKISDPLHFGETMGILMGDLSNQLAFEIVSDSNFDSDLKVKIIKLVSEELTNVVFGQLYDVLIPYKDKYSMHDILNIDYYKTAIYTYELPMLIGATIASIRNSEIQLLKEYALNAGIAFQIRDDILGVFGDEKKVGKPIDSDIKEGKKTMLTLMTEKYTSKQDLKTFRMLLGKKDLTSAELNKVKGIMKGSGALNYCIKKCEYHSRKAQKAISKSKIKEDNAGKEFLNNIAELMILRDI